MILDVGTIYHDQGHGVQHAVTCPLKWDCSEPSGSLLPVAI